MFRQTIPHATWTRIFDTRIEVYQDSGTSGLVTSDNGEDFDIECDGKLSFRHISLDGQRHPLDGVPSIDYAAARCNAEYQGWSCERERGHDGRHTAGDGGRVNGATWRSA